MNTQKYTYNTGTKCARTFKGVMSPCPDFTLDDSCLNFTADVTPNFIAVINSYYSGNL